MKRRAQRAGRMSSRARVKWPTCAKHQFPCGRGRNRMEKRERESCTRGIRMSRRRGRGWFEFSLRRFPSGKTWKNRACSERVPFSWKFRSYSGGTDVAGNIYFIVKRERGEERRENAHGDWNNCLFSAWCRDCSISSKIEENFWI